MVWVLSVTSGVDYGRRNFIAGTVTAAAVFGVPIPFLRNLAPGLTPIALAQGVQDSLLATKDGLTILGDRPINIEAPANLLDDAVTPSNRLFVRNHG